jgi:hypothetical protein
MPSGPEDSGAHGKERVTDFQGGTLDAGCYLRLIVVGFSFSSRRHFKKCEHNGHSDHCIAQFHFPAPGLNKIFIFTKGRSGARANEWLRLP